MNWKIGLFRLWIVFVSLFFGAVMISMFLDITREIERSKSIQLHER